MKIINHLFKIIVVSAMTFGCSIALATTFTPEQNKAIEQVIHNYLIKNPEVLVEAMQILQQKQITQMEQDSKKLIAKNASELFNATNRPFAGNAKGTIVIAELFDYRCSHCKAMDSVTKKIIQDNPNVKIIYVETPVFGEESMYAAKATLAAMKQNKYPELHSALLNDKSTELTKDLIIKTAKTIKLNIPKFEQDIKDPAIEKQLTANIALLRKMKIPGTPAFFITNVNNKKYDAVYGQFGPEVLQQKIDLVK
jgi:protein-disulfide isomerase